MYRSRTTVGVGSTVDAVDRIDDLGRDLLYGLLYII